MAQHYPRTLGFRECYGRLRTVLPSHILYHRHLAGLLAAAGNRHCFPSYAPRELARGAAIDTALIVFFILGGAHRPLYLLAGKADERPAEQYAPRKYPYYPSHAHYQRRGRGAFPQRCPPPACRRPPPPHPAILTQLALYIAVTAAMSIPLLLIASILIGSTAALEAPCRRLHLRHHPAPSVEHRNGVLVTGSYEVKKNSPDNGTQKRSTRRVLCSLLFADYLTINYGRIGRIIFEIVSKFRQ